MNNQSVSKLKQLTGGLIPKNDIKVWNYSSILANASRNDEDIELPATFRLWDSPIKNQLEKSTCAAHAMASAMEILEYYDTGDRNQFSTSWYYGYRKNSDFQEEGMYLSQLLETARTVGGVYKSLMPDNLHYSDCKKIILNMQDECLEEAQKHKIKNYAKISSKYDIMKAIYENKSPVLIGAMIYESFYNTDYSGIVSEPNIQIEECYGGHAMLCIGWTTIGEKIYLVVKNSWGEDWGDNGYCYFALEDNLPFLEMYIIFDEQNYHMNFPDIYNDRWSKEYIEKAVRTGIIDGYPDGTFNPEAHVTREQLAVVISKLIDKFKYF